MKESEEPRPGEVEGWCAEGMVEFFMHESVIFEPPIKYQKIVCGGWEGWGMGAAPN